MIKQYRLGSWLTEKQNISMSKGDMAEALILNSIFRLNGTVPIGDVEESQLVQMIEDAKQELMKGNDTKIDSIVHKVMYG